MKRPRTLPAFSKAEYVKAHMLLASQVAIMMGRKFEEGDWAHVYCTAKDIPLRGWSNLNIDVMHQGLGVEHKMLCVRSDKNIREHCGTSLMHPAATRSIRIPTTKGDPTKTARDVLRQYAELIRERRQKVAEDSPGTRPSLHTGWLLWQESLREFLYFEQETTEPNPAEYYAVWKESGGGARKTSKNLWVFEQNTDRKRFSITTVAGAKIQPYFDVPPPNNPNLYYFCVQGEELPDGLVRIWITTTTALLLAQKLGNLDKETISSAILKVADALAKLSEDEKRLAALRQDVARPIVITRDAYDALRHAFAGVSDEHMFQLFLRFVVQ